jgi:hypothetical protein
LQKNYTTLYRRTKMFIVRWFKNLVREYKYRKRIKELRKRDPFIYK